MQIEAATVRYVRLPRRCPDPARLIMSTFERYLTVWVARLA
jgi:hypothetical protein